MGKDMKRTDLATKKYETMKNDCFNGVGSPPNGCVIRLDLIWVNGKPIILDTDFIYDPAWDMAKVTGKPTISKALAYIEPSTSTPAESESSEEPEATVEAPKKSGWSSWTKPLMWLIAIAFILIVAGTFYFTCVSDKLGEDGASPDLEE